MNKKICLIILLFTCKICNAQNLVPNGDFEQYWSCPTGDSQLDTAKFWFDPANGQGFTGSPDYFNSCSTSAYAGVPNNGGGYQNAHSGSAYSGIIVHYPSTTIREYIEVQLTSPLIAGTCYQFEMFINSADLEKYTTDDIGVYFSDTIIQGINNALALPFTPQINNTSGIFPNVFNWLPVTQNYTAIGGENFIIIGNFKDITNTTVNVQNINAPYNLAYFYIDDVSLIPCSATGLNNLNNIAINVFPNPLTDNLSVRIDNNEPVEIILYDSSFRKLIQKYFTNSTVLNTELLAKGLYFYEIRDRNGLRKKGKVVKD